MKRLLMLAALAVILAGSSGCCNWLNRGAACNTCPTGEPAYGDPYLSSPSGIEGETILPGPP